jgi:hypothetical protein
LKPVPKRQDRRPVAVRVVPGGGNIGCDRWGRSEVCLRHKKLSAAQSVRQ